MLLSSYLRLGIAGCVSSSALPHTVWRTANSLFPNYLPIAYLPIRLLALQLQPCGQCLLQKNRGRLMQFAAIRPCPVKRTNPTSTTWSCPDSQAFWVVCANLENYPIP